MRDALDRRLGYPAHTRATLVVVEALDAAAELHQVAVLPGQFPGVAIAQPGVGDLHLPAVLDALVEDAVLVAEPVADGRDLQRRH